jgi:hypothetical protein
MIRLYAEYATADDLLRAIRRVRIRQIGKLEAYTPYPVPGIDRALGAPPSTLSVAVLAAGFGAAFGAYGLQWLLQAYLYPLNVGGRPPHFPLAFVPITFEMGVLFASITAFVAVIVGGKLLRLWHPSNEVEGIESATGNQFWLELELVGPDIDLDQAEELLRTTEPLIIRRGVLA